MKRYHWYGTYFLTWVTKNRTYRFQDETLCSMRLHDLQICKELKKFQLHAFCLNYDHFHILLSPNEVVANVSQIMQSLKRNSSRNINKYLNKEEFDHMSRGGYLTFDHEDQISRRHQEKRTENRYSPRQHDHGKIFARQKSFHDQIIHDEKSFHEHVRYTNDNFLKHDLPDDWRWTSKRREWENIIDIMQF